jgi:hypothetical protein
MRDASPHDNPEPSAWEARLQALLAEMDAIAADLEGQPAPLLTLLRQIEALHRRIQDGPFRTSLPADRHQFFTLLQAMETSGGWPYIPRLQLRTFLDMLERDDQELPLGQDPEPGGADPVIAEDGADSK